MAIKHFGPGGNDTLDSGPPFVLTQQLPHNAQVFAAAAMAAEKIHTFPVNKWEDRFIYKDIPVQRQAITSEFNTAIPDIDLYSFDVSIPDSTMLGLYDIRLQLHNSKNPDHVIKIQAEDPEDPASRLAVLDNYPLRAPRSAPYVGRQVLKDFLGYQLRARSQDGLYLASNTAQLGMYLGQFARGQYHEITTAKTTLPDGRVIHTEKDSTYDSISTLASTPSSIVHSTWLTAALPDDELGLAENLRARTIARYHAQDNRDQGNNLQFEVDARKVFEPEALFTTCVFKHPQERVAVARQFAAVLGEYLRSPRDA